MEDRTVTAACRSIRNRSISCVELVEEHLRQIARVDSLLRACVTVMDDTARAQARAADAVLAAGGTPGMLHGIPVGIKDIIATRGVYTKGGSRVLANWIPAEDATVVTRLAEAGAIALCKTNTHEFAFGTFTPPTRNPWDLARIPGGSSGGSAAAVAAGECLAALGTDTGGSIRIPAACCGVTGLKPTAGLVSRAGIIPLSWSLDHAGPITRTVEDCALLLRVLAGYDPRDSDSQDVSLPDFVAALASARAPETVVRGTRVGVPTNYFFQDIDPEVATVVRAAIAIFAELGGIVEDVTIPVGIDDLFTTYRAIMRPEAYTFHQDMGWLATRADDYTPAVRANLELGATLTASDYIRAQRARTAFTEGMRALLRQVDVLLLPTLPIVAPRADALEQPLRIDDHEEEASHALLRYTFPFDLTGQPALSLCCGFSTQGLPVGLQLVAGHFQEATLLRLGHAYQRVTDWHTRRPHLPTAI
jgi:aspartyl-tRNA(Asn)/glutamyl-tRNA(Gln) amidotransferase subunit A